MKATIRVHDDMSVSVLCQGWTWGLVDREAEDALAIVRKRMDAIGLSNAKGQFDLEINVRPNEGYLEYEDMRGSWYPFVKMCLMLRQQLLLNGLRKELEDLIARTTKAGFTITPQLTIKVKDGTAEQRSS